MTSGRMPAAEAAPPAAGPVRWSATTGTRVDTGRWFRRAPVSAALVGDRLVLSAEGPRPFRRVLPASALGRAVYNHVTGELAFPAPQPGGAGPQPATPSDVPGLLLDALAARELLDIAAAAS
ncbi:MAG: hypothetical protein EBZ59_04345 [Planctomycetia bacterium]|nr:hypothetical protein [Planctomycetia bacterium]